MRFTTSSLLRFTLAPALLAALAATAAPASAQEAGPKFGMVNLAVVYNFHPLVQTYVPAEHKFMKVEGGFDFKARFEASRDNIRRVQLAIADVYQKVKALDEERNVAYMKKWQERRRIETDMDDWGKNPANSGKPAPDFAREKQRLKEIEDELFKEAKAFDEAKAKLDQAAEAENEKLKAINYLVGPDHDKQLARILDEVNETIRKVAAKRGCLGVFNASRFYHYARPERPAEFDFHRVYNPAYETAPDNIYAADGSVKEAISAHAGMGPDMVKFALDAKLERYRMLMAGADRLLEPFQDQNLNDTVLVGGEELTAEVVGDLLRMYKVEDETVQLIVKGIEDKKIY